MGSLWDSLLAPTHVLCHAGCAVSCHWPRGGFKAFFPLYFLSLSILAVPFVRIFSVCFSLPSTFSSLPAPYNSTTPTLPSPLDVFGIWWAAHHVPTPSSPPSAAPGGVHFRGGGRLAGGAAQASPEPPRDEPQTLRVLWVGGTAEAIYCSITGKFSTAGEQQVMSTNKGEYSVWIMSSVNTFAHTHA